MSQVITAPPAHAAPGPPPPPASPLRLVRRIGYAVLGLQLACFLAWSAIVFSRFSLTPDFSLYNQAWFLIAHGNLDPYSTAQSFPFWQSHCEFVMWPLALLYWVWPHAVTLLWLQDLCVVGAEAVAFTWLCERAQKYRPGRDAAWLAGVGIVLLAGNPWIWWAVSFDYHAETLAILFAVLLARDLAGRRHRAWAWVVPLLACGDVAGTYLAGIGLGGMLAGRRTRRPGAVMACLGVAATLIITLAHANRGSALNQYDYLATGVTGSSLSLAALAKGILAHPLGAVRALWGKRVDVLANLAPAGLVGLGDLPVLPIAAVVLLANTLFAGVLFAEPIFQNLPIYILVPVGTIAVLGGLMRRRRRSAWLLAGLLVAQTLGWAAVWGPRTPGQWLRVPAPAAATLASVEARIPSSAEVVGSQGVIGRFAERGDARPLTGAGAIPVAGGQIWFVIVPSAGIETMSPASAMALIGELAGPLHATLVTHANGIWAFRWHRPSGVNAITVPAGSTPLPAWAGPSPAGRAVLAGPVAGWHVTSAGREGYVADGLAWQEPPGWYQALVTLSATGPVNVEVWNDTGRTLLARHSIPATTGVESVVLLVDATTAYRATAYAGWGPFRADFAAPPPGERLEVRVWTPGGGTVNVYSAELAAGAVRPPAVRPHREPGG
jgi:Predicted membrane protein (DUF2079)